MINLENKTFLITGASSGIGEATALLCDSLGARLILTGRNEERLKQTQLRLKKPCLIIPADLSKTEDVARLVADIGPIDGLVHAAGIVKPVPVKYLKTKNINEIFDINFNSAVLLCSELSANKKINRSASMVFISSVSAHHPYIGGAMYGASKAALEAYSRSLALELAGKGIRANVIAPALVRTAIFQQTELASSEDEFKKHQAQYPLGFGEPEDVANCIAFLLSSASRWITGTTIKMDGGLLLNSKK